LARSARAGAELVAQQVRRDLKQPRAHAMADVDEPVAGGERAGEGLGGEVLRHVRVGDAMTQIAANLGVMALEHVSEHHGIVPGRCHRSCNARHAAEVPADRSWLCMASRDPPRTRRHAGDQARSI
jgi:hypothetical protein